MLVRLSLNLDSEVEKTFSSRSSFSYCSFLSSQVTDSGFVSFGKPISYADPQTFPVTTGAYQLQKTALVAAYWSDVDIRCGGAVYYRMTKDPATLVDIGSVVKELGTTASQSFIPKEALIVTYYEVAKLSVPCDPTTVSIVNNNNIMDQFFMQL